MPLTSLKVDTGDTKACVKFIGILRGSENTFPEALARYINEQIGRNRVFAEDVVLGQSPQDHFKKYDLLFDRISHLVPFYRSLLHSSWLGSTYLINQDVIFRNEDRFNLLCAAGSMLGIPTPQMVLLPHQHPPNGLPSSSFRNLIYPLNWQMIFSCIRFPAILKSIDQGPELCFWVTDPTTFFQAYHRTGSRLMILQQAFEPNTYYRIYLITPDQYQILPVNVHLTGPLRYQKSGLPHLTAQQLQRIHSCLPRLTTRFHADFMQIEVAFSEGKLFLTDILFQSMDLDYNILGKVHFEWLVQNLAQMMMAKVLHIRNMQIIKDL